MKPASLLATAVLCFATPRGLDPQDLHHLSQVFWVKTVPASAGRYQGMQPSEAEPLDGLRRSLASSAFAEQPTPATAFVNVNLIRMDRERVERDQTVVVQGGRIVAIGRTSDLRPPDEADVVDGRERYLLPGLTDSHVHITTDMPWAPARPDFGDAPLYLAHGVTTVVNLRGTQTQLEWKRRIEAGEILGPTIYTSGEFVNEPRVVTAEDVQREVSQQARDGYDLIKFHEVWTPGAGFTTRRGLSRDSYLRMFQAARETGLPVVGHVPVNLGLEGLLTSSAGAVAHIGEFNRLHFLLGLRTLLATMTATLILLLIVAGWGAAALLRRVRRRSADYSRTLRRAQILTTGVVAMALPVFAGGFVVGPGGLFYTSVGWRIGTTLFAIGLVIIALLSIAASVKVWRERAVTLRSRLPLAAAAMTSVTLMTLVAVCWLPFLWRNTDAGIGRVAIQLRDAGIAVQSTLVVYELFEAESAQRVLGDPSFKFLPLRVQTLWRRMAEARGLRSFEALIMPPRFPEFTRTIAGTFHRHGVQLLAGTDAMGLPMTIPGSSLLRELHLLNQSGLTPYEAIRAATVNPASFLGKEKEFGAIAVGKRADLLLLDRNPLETVSAFDQPAGVMVRGRWLPRERLQEMLSALR